MQKHGQAGRCGTTDGFRAFRSNPGSVPAHGPRPPTHMLTLCKRTHLLHNPPSALHMMLHMLFHQRTMFMMAKGRYREAELRVLSTSARTLSGAV